MKMKIRNFLITGFIAALVIGSQGCRKAFFINGNGHVVTETRQMLL